MNVLCSIYDLAQDIVVGGPVIIFQNSVWDPQRTTKRSVETFREQNKKWKKVIFSIVVVLFCFIKTGYKLQECIYFIYTK